MGRYHYGFIHLNLLTKMIHIRVPLTTENIEDLQGGKTFTWTFTSVEGEDVEVIIEHQEYEDEIQ